MPLAMQIFQELDFKEGQAAALHAVALGNGGPQTQGAGHGEIQDGVKCPSVLGAKQIDEGKPPAAPLASHGCRGVPVPGFFPAVSSIGRNVRLSRSAMPARHLTR